MNIIRKHKIQSTVSFLGGGGRISSHSSVPQARRVAHGPVNVNVAEESLGGKKQQPQNPLLQKESFPDSLHICKPTSGVWQ